MKTITKTLISYLLIVLLLCSSIATALAATENTEGKPVTYDTKTSGKCTLSVGDTYSYAGGYPGVILSVNGKSAICSWQEKYNPPAGTVTATKYQLANSDLRAKLVYWLLGGKDTKAKQYQAVAKAAWEKGRSDGDSTTYWLVSWVHTAVDYLQQGSTIMYASDKWETAMKSFLNTAKSWDNVPGGAKVFYYYPAGNAYQSVMSYEIQHGYVKIVKKSSNPSLTNGNSAYSLAGARYAFYTNKSCTDASYIGFVTTDSNGVAYSKDGSKEALRNLKLGTYYVKETIAPTNYNLDSTVYTVKVTEANVETTPYVLNVKDTPKNPYGYVKIVKKSGKTGVTNGNSAYSLAGARYAFSKSATDFSTGGSNYLGYVTTDENGTAHSKDGSRAALRNLTPGTYYIKETTAPKGYEIDNTVYTVKVTASHTTTSPYVLNVTDMPIQPHLKIIKESSNPALTNNNPNYSMAGIWYQLFKDKECTDANYVGAVELDENGVGYSKNGSTSAIRNLIPGTYYVREYFPSAIRDTVKYLLDPTVYTITLTTSHTESSPYVLNVVDNPTGGGYGQINKYSAQPEITVDSDCYSLENAEYCVYASQEDAANQVSALNTVTTNASGIASFGPVDPGTYYIREKTAPKGYRKDDTVYPIEIIMDETTVLDVQETPLDDPASVLLQKRNATSGQTVSVYDMSGAEYTFKFYSGYFSSVEELENIIPTRTWVMKTDENGRCMLAEDFKVSGDDFFYSANNNVPIPILPLGTLTIQETKAPPERVDSFGRTFGFYLDDTIYIRQITEEGLDLDVHSYNAPTSDEYEIPNTEIKVTKAWDDGDNRDGLRPQNITINLYRDGELYRTGTVQSSENWYYTFRDLPIGVADFSLDEKYRPYEYTIEEISVDGYDTTLNDIIPDPDNDGTYLCNINNYHKPSQINLNGEKIWVDDNNAYNKRPESVTINLFANGKKVDTTIANEASDWKYSFEDLFEYDNGVKITYTVTETPVYGYTTEVNGTTITNTLKRGTSTVRKVDENGNPMEHVGFKLFNSSEKQVKSSLENGKYVFNSLTDEDFIYYTSSDGTIEVTNLPYGTYHFKEVEVPTAYMPYEQDMPVVLDPDDDDMSADLTVQNNKAVMPNAGGAGNIIYYIIASSFAVAAVVLLCIFYIKKKNKKRKEVSKE